MGLLSNLCRVMVGRRRFSIGMGYPHPKCLIFLLSTDLSPLSTDENVSGAQEKFRFCLTF